MVGWGVRGVEKQDESWSGEEGGKNTKIWKKMLWVSPAAQEKEMKQKRNDLKIVFQWCRTRFKKTVKRWKDLLLY